MIKQEIDKLISEYYKLSEECAEGIDVERKEIHRLRGEKGDYSVEVRDMGRLQAKLAVYTKALVDITNLLEYT